MACGAKSKDLDLVRDYEKCKEDIEELRAYLDQNVDKIVDPKTTNVKFLKNAKSKLSIYEKRFSMQKCGNVYKFIDVVDDKELRDFLGVGVAISSVKQIIDITISQWESENIGDIKKKLGIAIEFLQDNLDKNIEINK